MYVVWLWTTFNYATSITSLCLWILNCNVAGWLWTILTMMLLMPYFIHSWSYYLNPSLQNLLISLLLPLFANICFCAKVLLLNVLLLRWFFLLLGWEQWLDLIGTIMLLPCSWCHFQQSFYKRKEVLSGADLRPCTSGGP